MLCFGGGFIPSTLFLSLLLLLSIAVPSYGDGEICKSVLYNPDVFDEIPILEPIENRECKCYAYICKVNTTFYFGKNCWDDVINFCKPNMEVIQRSEHSFVFGQFISIETAILFAQHLQLLYQKYMEVAKPFGNDSMQERYFWLKAMYFFDLDYSGYKHFWDEKAFAYIPMNLQNFTNEIQNSQIPIKDKIEEKVKAVVQLQTESSFNDVQNAANQSFPEYEYFQKKFAEKEVIKMEIIKMCADNILKSYLLKSNETLLNVETEMNNAQNELMAMTNFEDISGIQYRQNFIMGRANSAKEKVLDLLKFANETMENISCFTDDEIGYFQSAGYEARKAMKDFESEKEMKDLMKEIKDAIEDIKKIGKAAQKTADKAQSIANESNMTAMNAENTAKNAKEAADSAGKNVEALHSNGRKNGGFEVAMILCVFVLLI